MKITTEISLRDFEFWSGAKYTAEMLTPEELDQIEFAIEDAYDQIDETTVNDIFWFDTDWIAELLGYENFEEMYQDRTHDNLDEELENEDTVASYKEDDKTTVDIIKDKDGKFSHSYKKDGKEISKSKTFSTEEEAEKELVKNNPKAKRIENK